nr:hypothetical protein [Tanacetum cinerariifolium]
GRVTKHVAEGYERIQLILGWLGTAGAEGEARHAYQLLEAAVVRLADIALVAHDFGHAGSMGQGRYMEFNLRDFLAYYPAPALVVAQVACSSKFHLTAHSLARVAEVVIAAVFTEWLVDDRRARFLCY